VTDEPSAPDAERREQVLAALGELIAHGGHAPFLAPPVRPHAAAFPEPWKPTCGGVTALLRRLAWHAGTLGDRTIVVSDERLGAPPTEHKPQTRVELAEVRARALAFMLVVIGDDDIGGTLAHEIGVAHAALDRAHARDPYRSVQEPVIAIEPERDLERGSIATVYLGLGVLAANAAFQQYSSRTGIDAYASHVYEVHRAGYVPMSELAFLLAVQAVVRGEASPPAGLGGPQRDEVSGWIAALELRGDELRARLNIPVGARGEPRPAVTRFADQVEEGTETGGDDRGEVVPPTDVEASALPARKHAFRWQSTRGRLGALTGMLLGAGIAIAAAAPEARLWLVIAGGGSGHVIGRRVRVARCSACVTVLASPHAEACRRCGATMRGDIAQLADRLEAEEQLETPRDT